MYLNHGKFKKPSLKMFDSTRHNLQTQVRSYLRLHVQERFENLITQQQKIRKTVSSAIKNNHASLCLKSRM